MFNFISTGQNTLVNTTTPLVFGFGPGQTPPPGYLIQNLAASGTITLPKINQVPPTAPGTPGTTPGVSDGYPFFIDSISNFSTTLTPASGDTCDIAVLAPVDTAILIADAANNKWRAFGPVTNSTNATVTAAGASTLAATTRYLIVTAASTQTIPAPSGLTNGQPFTYMNESVGSLTITPASGTIDTTASFTLTTLQSATFLSDGTNFHLVSN